MGGNETKSAYPTNTRCYVPSLWGTFYDGRPEVIAKDRKKARHHRPVAEILATAPAGSPFPAGGRSLVGRRWSGHSYIALPQSWTSGCASDSWAEATGSTTPGKSEAGSLGDRGRCKTSTLARCVLSTRSCRAIHAATTRHPFRAVLRRCTRRSDWAVRPRLGTRWRSQRCWW